MQTTVFQGMTLQVLLYSSAVLFVSDFLVLVVMDASEMDWEINQLLFFNLF